MARDFYDDSYKRFDLELLVTDSLYHIFNINNKQNGKMEDLIINEKNLNYPQFGDNY